MDPKFIVEAPKSKFIDAAKTPNEAKIPRQRMKKASQDKDEDNTLVPDLIEDFLEDDAIEEDLEKYPWNWIIALVIITPAIFDQVLEANEFTLEQSILTPVEPLLEFLSTSVVLIGPIAALFFSIREHIGPTLICAMGTSAAVLIQGTEGPLFLQTGLPDFLSNGAGPMVISIALIAPLILVLKNKKKLLDPGNSRNAWCTLMATSILMFAYGTFYQGAEQLHTSDDLLGDCSDSLLASLCNHDSISSILGEGGTLGGAGMLAIALAIGWAWPKGRYIVEEIAEDILDTATNK